MTSAEQERREILAEALRRREAFRDSPLGIAETRERNPAFFAIADLAEWIEARGEPKHASDGFQGETWTAEELKAKHLGER